MTNPSMQLRAWREELEKAKDNGTLHAPNGKVTCQRHRVVGTAKKSKNALPSLDRLLAAWFGGARSSNRIVNRFQLHEQAVEFLKDPEVRTMCGGKATVSSGYIDKFMRRSRLKVKTVKKQTAFTEVEIAEKAQKFHSHIFRLLPHVGGVLNFDEIPASLSGRMGMKKGVFAQNDQDCRATFDGNDNKRFATVIAFGACKRTDVGWQRVEIQPIILLKGEPKQERVRNEKYDERVVVWWTPKGVINSATMINVADHVAKTTSQHGPKPWLIILDSARSHLTKTTLDKFYKKGCAVSVIPAGCTSWLQYIDTDVASVYRALHSRSYVPHEGRKKTSATKRMLLSTMVAESVPPSVYEVVSAFTRLGYLGPQLAECRIRNIAYQFVSPILTNNDTQVDADKLKRRIEEAAAEGQRAPPIAPPIAPKLGRRKKPVPIDPRQPTLPASFQRPAPEQQ